MNLKGEFVNLREMELSDMKFLRQMINDSPLKELVVEGKFPISSFQQYKWFKKSIDDSNNLRYIIESKEGETLGLAILRDIDGKNYRANHRIIVDYSEFRFKGIGTDTVKAVIKYVFEELQLKRLDTSWLESNQKFQKSFLKLGQEIGTVRKSYVFKYGKYHNLMVARLLNKKEESENENFND